MHASRLLGICAFLARKLGLKETRFCLGFSFRLLPVCVRCLKRQSLFYSTFKKQTNKFEVKKSTDKVKNKPKTNMSGEIRGKHNINFFRCCLRFCRCCLLAFTAFCKIKQFSAASFYALSCAGFAFGVAIIEVCSLKARLQQTSKVLDTETEAKLCQNLG